MGLTSGQIGIELWTCEVVLELKLIMISSMHYPPLSTRNKMARAGPRTYFHLMKQITMHYYMKIIIKGPYNCLEIVNN